MSDRRVPPHNLDAERSLLGGVLLRNDALNLIEWLAPEDFYDPKHREVFAAMRALEAKSRPIDPVTLEEQLGQMGKLAAVGGLSFLAEMVTAVPTADNIEHYATIVRDKASARRLITTASEIAARGFGDYGEVRDFLDEAERAIFQVTQQDRTGGAVPVDKLLKQVFNSLTSRFSAGDGVTGLPTGFFEIDAMTAGLQPSDLIIVAARPSMGKTSLAMSIAQNASLPPYGFPVLVFSLEMSGLQLAERMLCSEARVDSSLLRRGQMQRQDVANLTAAADVLHSAPLLIDDTPAPTVGELRARARRWRSNRELFGDKKYGLIVVDYLQLMRGMPTQKNANREQEISEISRGLKALAKEMECPVLALSQLSRKCEDRADKRPMLSDLRECVPGDTLVVLADGRRVPIRELVGDTPRVAALSERGRLIEADSDRVWRVGRRPVFAVRLASGRLIRATAKHRLLGAPGWRRVEELRPGDRLATARRLPEPVSPDVWPENRVVLLGHLIGDGSYPVHQPLRYTTGSEDNSRAVERAAIEEFGVTVTRHPGRGNWHQLVLSGNGDRWHPAGVNLWLRRLGIFGQRSHEKRVPPAAFRLANDQVALLLRHLWATDGTISVRKPGQRGAHGVHFSTCSRGLAEDVAALLLRLGIVASIQTVRQRQHRPVHLVWVRGVEMQTRFLEEVGAFGPRRGKALALADALVGVEGNTNVDTLPREVFERVRLLMGEAGISQRRMAAMRGTSYGGAAHFSFAPSRRVVREYAELLHDEELARRCDADVFWDRVVAIEPDGEEEVYDLTVPGPSCWLADGIVSHNSGAIEQDADVIMFIFRQEIYDKEKTPEDRRGVAEVIIGKHRNGPTGVVDLSFLGKYTRFENLSRRAADY